MVYLQKYKRECYGKGGGKFLTSQLSETNQNEEKEVLFNKPINVLSLFDGISCGQVALERAGIKVANYFASEIDRYAIKVTQHNYPNTIQLGDVTKVSNKDLPKIDLLIGGSPCQGFSTLGSGLNFEDPRSLLFFEYVRLLEELKPKYFLLENVRMKKKWKDEISRHLGVEPVFLNSLKTSTQRRPRYFWANFPISEPEEKKIELSSLLEEKEKDGKPWRTARARGLYVHENQFFKEKPKNFNGKTVQCLFVTTLDKSYCLTTTEKDTLLTTLPEGIYPDYKNKGLPFRNYTPVERVRIMSLPDNYCEVISKNQILEVTGNGWEVNMITHVFNCMKEFEKGINDQIEK